MAPEPGSNRELGEGYKYVAMGLTFAGGIIMFMAAGFALDRWLKLTPILTVTGTLVGAVLSFLSVYTRLTAEEDARRREKDAGK